MSQILIILTCLIIDIDYLDVVILMLKGIPRDWTDLSLNSDSLNENVLNLSDVSFALAKAIM